MNLNDIIFLHTSLYNYSFTKNTACEIATHFIDCITKLILYFLFIGLYKLCENVI